MSFTANDTTRAQINNIPEKSHVIPLFTLHNISLRLLRSVNTLNPKLKFKTILTDKSQLLLKALYLEATLTFLRFAAKHSLKAQLFRGSYQLYGGKLFNRKGKPPTMSEKRHKISKFANYQNIIVRNSPAFERHVFVSSQDR